MALRDVEEHASTTRTEGSDISLRSTALDGTLQTTLMILEEKRKEDNRPYDITLMTRDQIREEKRNIQSSLFCCHEIHRIPMGILMNNKLKFEIRKNYWRRQSTECLCRLYNLEQNDGVLQPLFDRYNEMKLSLGEFTSVILDTFERFIYLVFEEDINANDVEEADGVDGTGVTTEYNTDRNDILQNTDRRFAELAERLQELEEEGDQVKAAMRSVDSEKDKRKLEAQWFETLKKKNLLLREEHELALRVKERRLQDEKNIIVRELHHLYNTSDERQALEEFEKEKCLLKSYHENVYQRNIIVEKIHADIRRNHTEDDVIRRALRQHGMTSSSAFDDDFLSVLESEPEVWSLTVDQQILDKMNKDDVRRQNIIWELIQTESNYCRALKTLEQITKKSQSVQWTVTSADQLLIIVGGMTRELEINPEEVHQMFPKLNDLIDVHVQFRSGLRELQNQSEDKYIDKIGSVLKEQFSESSGDRMRRIYTAFCRSKSAALNLYHVRMNSDRCFHIFMQRYNKVRLCNKRRIPDFLTMIGARIAQYPLLIERIIKATSDEEEKSILVETLDLSRDILKRVNDMLVLNGP